MLWSNWDSKVVNGGQTTKRKSLRKKNKASTSGTNLLFIFQSFLVTSRISVFSSRVEGFTSHRGGRQYFQPTTLISHGTLCKNTFTLCRGDHCQTDNASHILLRASRICQVTSCRGDHKKYEIGPIEQISLF